MAMDMAAIIELGIPRPQAPGRVRMHSLTTDASERALGRVPVYRGLRGQASEASSERRIPEAAFALGGRQRLAFAHIDEQNGGREKQQDAHQGLGLEWEARRWADGRVDKRRHRMGALRTQIIRMWLENQVSAPTMPVVWR